MRPPSRRRGRAGPRAGRSRSRSARPWRRRPAACAEFVAADREAASPCRSTAVTPGTWAPRSSVPMLATVSSASVAVGGRSPGRRRGCSCSLPFGEDGGVVERGGDLVEVDPGFCSGCSSAGPAGPRRGSPLRRACRSLRRAARRSRRRRRRRTSWPASSRAARRRRRWAPSRRRGRCQVDLDLVGARHEAGHRGRFARVDAGRFEELPRPGRPCRRTVRSGRRRRRRRRRGCLPRQAEIALGEGSSSASDSPFEASTAALKSPCSSRDDERFADDPDRVVFGTADLVVDLLRRSRLRRSLARWPMRLSMKSWSLRRCRSRSRSAVRRVRRRLRAVQEEDRRRLPSHGSTSLSKSNGSPFCQRRAFELGDDEFAEVVDRRRVVRDRVEVRLQLAGRLHLAFDEDERTPGAQAWPRLASKLEPEAASSYRSRCRSRRERAPRAATDWKTSLDHGRGSLAGRRRLLDGDRLGQIAGLVDVEAAARGRCRRRAAAAAGSRRSAAGSSRCGRPRSSRRRPRRRARSPRSRSRSSRRRGRAPLRRWRGPWRAPGSRSPRRRPGSTRRAGRSGRASSRRRRRRRSGCRRSPSASAPPRGRPAGRCGGRGRGRTSGRGGWRRPRATRSSQRGQRLLDLRGHVLQLGDQLGRGARRASVPRSSASRSPIRYIAATWATKVLVAATLTSSPARV